MATPTQTPNPTPSTPTSVDINTPADQLRQAAVAATAPAEPVAPAAQPATPTATPAPTQEPYSVQTNPDGTVYVKLDSGEEFRGSWQEVLPKMAKSKYDSSSYAKQKAAEAEALRAQIPQPAQPDQPAQPSVPQIQRTPEEMAGINWVVNDAMATKEAEARIIEVVAKNLGYQSFDQLKQVMGGVVRTTENAQAGDLVAGFMQMAPDFPNTPEASSALVDLAVQLGFPETPAGLYGAHQLAVQRGMYKPVPVQTQQPASPTPNPTLITGSAPTGAQPEINPYDPKVSLEQVKAWAERARNQ